MTTLTHTYTGAVVYLALSRAIGLDAEIAAPVVGGLLGAAPDLLDWMAFKLRLAPRWRVYQYTHRSRPILILEALLIAPGIHVLFDLLLHPPVIPSAEARGEYDYELFTVFGHTVRRRDIHWLTGEVMLIALTTVLLLSI